MIPATCTGSRRDESFYDAKGGPLENELNVRPPSTNLDCKDPSLSSKSKVSHSASSGNPGILLDDRYVTICRAWIPLGL